MDEFKRYQSIENHFNQKYIGRWLYKYPELKDERYIVSEKLDGANLQFYFSSGVMKIGRRNAWLEKGERFFGLWDFLERNIDFSQILNFVEEEYLIDNLRIYCEFVSNDINKRIDYSWEKKLVLHDVEMNGKILPHFSFYMKSGVRNNRFYKQKPEAFDFEAVEDEIFYKISKSGIIFNECYSIEDSLDEALQKKFSSEEIKKNGGVERDSEGTIIRPYCFFNGPHHFCDIFILKKKNSKFEEISNKKKREPKISKIIEEKLIFLNYINENRLKSIFTKEGEISCVKDIGKYIKLIMKDAVEDFKKDYPSIEDPKFFSPGGKVAANLIKVYLKKRHFDLEKGVNK